MWTTPLCVVSSWPHAGAVADTSQHIGYHHMRCARCHSMNQHSKYHNRRQHIHCWRSACHRGKSLALWNDNALWGGTEVITKSSDIHTIVVTCHAHNLDTAQATHYQIYRIAETKSRGTRVLVLTFIRSSLKEHNWTAS